MLPDIPDINGITPDIWYHANLMCPDFLQGLRETIEGELHVAEFVLLEPFSRPGNKENGKTSWKIFVHCHQKRKIVLSSRFRPKWNVFLLTVKVETAFNLGLRPVFPLKRADGDVYGRNLPLGINKTCLHPIIHEGEVSDKDIPWWNSNSVARRSEKLFLLFFCSWDVALLEKQPSQHVKMMLRIIIHYQNWT